jgi:energy-coupling factor transporter ATP-binding protein EcfA2
MRALNTTTRQRREIMARIADQDPTGLAPLIQRIDAWVASSRCFPSLEDDRASIEALLKQIQDRQASLETPLRILLLGGTGVGKSTLFNALGGADLAQAASVRPTTRELTAYYHEANGSGALGHLESKAKLVGHERALLRDKIVIDAPDFDSTARENRTLLEEALSVTDLALCVVTSEKYMSSELFELIEAHREGLEFVFLLNKLDRAGDGDLIVNDLRAELERHGIFGARILQISALSVRQAQLAAEEQGLSGFAEEVTIPGEAGQWAEVRSLLEKELNDVRIREIKAAKLADRVRGILARVEERVPTDVPDRVEAWRNTWSATLKDLTNDLSRSFFTAIRTDFELQNILRYLFGTSFGGLFGIFMTLVYGLRSVLMPGYTRARRFTSTDLEELLGDRLKGVQIATVERRVEVLLERFEVEGRRQGFSSDAEEHEGFLDPNVPSGVAALVISVRAQATRQFYTTVRDTVGRGDLPRAGRLLWNVFPAVVIGLTIYAFLGTLISTGVGLSPTAVATALKGTIPLLEGGLLALVLSCLIQWPLAERIIERRIRTSLGLLEGVVETAVIDCLGEAIVSAPERVLGEILERHRAFEHLREDAGRVLREDAEPVRSLLAQPELPEEGERRRAVRAKA